MIKEFVSYEQAVALKELGFNKECFATWNGETLDMSLQIPSDDYFTQAPLKQQVFRWFREKYEGEHWIGKRAGKLYFIRYVFLRDEAITFGEESIFNTYEEAENTCIDTLIELAKQQKY
jgi:hypothetical protein